VVPGSPPAIPDYTLLRCVGHGSYGEVWLGRNVFGEYRAVKVVYRRGFSDVRPFQREFEGIRKFEPISRSHPSQLAVLHAGKNDEAGYFYYVMELADDASSQRTNGKPSVPQYSTTPSLHDFSAYVPHTLRHDLDHHGRLPIAECVQIGLSLTTALSHLHQHGLVHRDIKPSNIIFVNGAPKLADIGLVTDASADCSIVGTEGYLAPEGPGTPQADIYALGKVLYEMSMGRDRRDFPDLPPEWAEMPDREQLLELNEVLLKACAKDPVQRYTSAEEMHGDLELLQRGKSVKRKRALQRWYAAGRAAGVAVSSLAAVLVLSMLLLNWLHGRKSHSGVPGVDPDPELHSSIPEVDELVERGNQSAISQTPERLNQALEFFNKALKLDPKFLPAYFGVFRVRVFQYCTSSGWAGLPSAQAASNLHVAARKLMEIDPNRAEAWIAASFIKCDEGDGDGAKADDRQAASRWAGSKEARGFAHTICGNNLMVSGEYDAALREYQRAEQAFKNDPVIEVDLGAPYFAKGNFGEAMKHFSMSTNIEPRFSIGHYFVCRVHEELGRFPEAIAEAEQYDELSGHHECAVFYADLRKAVQDDPIHGYWQKRLEQAWAAPSTNEYYVARLYFHLGDTNKAYEWLERAAQHSAFGELAYDPFWNHQDERFRVIAKKAGLSGY
jgi:serine/threonine protein kinase